MKIIGQMNFPEFSGIKCNMMPIIQGDSSSLPKEYRPYSEVIDHFFIDKDSIGFLTIDEAFVDEGKSQRGYNSKGINRNVHIEVGRYRDQNIWGTPWGGSASPKTFLEESTKVLIANSISDTCKVWDVLEKSYTLDGDLAEYLNKYPEDSGELLKSGQVVQISIFTPHECIPQKKSGIRQFFRIVGKGVHGREDYFTENPLMKGEICHTDI